MLILYKEMYGIEYEYNDGRTTFDIFEKYEEAENFAKNLYIKTNYIFPTRIFKAKFNTEYLYKENNYWNYEDYSDLIIEEKDIKEYKSF